MPSTTPLLLLKTRSSPTDPYETLLSSPSSGNYEPIFIPVLQHSHFNLPALKDHITSRRIVGVSATKVAQDGTDSEGYNTYGGLVITSQRAVEALSDVLTELVRENPDLLARFLDDTLIYVVGPATKNSLVHLGFAEDHVQGQDCGNGGALAEFIVNEYRQTRSLLFLTGETHGTVIPQKCSEREPPIHVEELVIYKTVERDGFENEFRGALDALDELRFASKGKLPQSGLLGRTDSVVSNNGGPPKVEGADGKSGDENAVEDTPTEEGKDEVQTRWVIIFSPSGTHSALKVVEEKQKLENGGVKYHICTIGPTTEDYMKEGFHRTPDVVAKVPSPEGVLAAIKKFEGKE